jgi:hypothetical protein
MASRKLGQASISHFFAPRGGDAPKKKKIEDKTPMTQKGAKITNTKTSTNGLEAFAAKRTAADSPAKEKTPSVSIGCRCGCVREGEREREGLGGRRQKK